MKSKRIQNKKQNNLAWSFGIPCGGMMLVMLLSGFSPFGFSSMLYSDSYHQYFPFFKAFIQALRNGDSLLYSFQVGMGIDYLGLIAYYLASPLYLLGILVPDALLLGYFSILTPIRLGLAGLFFALFLKKIFNKDDLSIAIFGSFYALCAWAMGYMWNVMWLDTFALLPLVAMGMAALLSERKFILYTVALFLSVWSNYYIGFFTCIFVLLSFICWQICCWKGFKRFFFDLLWIAGFSALAIGMTAVLELSSFAALQTTQSSVNKFPDKFALNIAEKKLYSNVNADWEAAKQAWANGQTGVAFTSGWSAIKCGFLAILDGMRQALGNMNGGIEPTFKEGLPNLYCGVGTILFAFLFLTCKEVKLREKICAVVFLLFLVLSFLLRQLDYIWHGFHFTNMIPYRFSFIFSFILVYMAYRAYTLKDNFKLWQVITAGILAIAVFACSQSMKTFIETVSSEQFSSNFSRLISNWSWSESDWTELGEHISTYAFIVYNSVFLTFYIGLLVFLYYPRKELACKSWKAEQDRQNALQQRKRLGSTLLLIIMGVEIAMNLVNFASNFGGTSTTHYPRGKEDAAKIYAIMENRENSPFYRAETTHSQTLNDGALNGYHGISAFTSSANVRVTEFMKDLGYGAKNTYNRYCFEESSPVANLFLNLKYMIERNGNTAKNTYFDVVASSNNVHLLENNAYLPLGFLANSELGHLDFEASDDGFDFQNTLLSVASGVNEDVWNYVLGDELSITSNDVTINQQKDDGYCSYTAGKSGTIVYTYTPYREGLMCIDLTQSKRNAFTVWYNGKQLYSETYSLPQMLSVCDVKPGDTVEIKFTCKAGESGTIDLNAAVLDEEIFRQAYSALNCSTLALEKFSNTTISGTINCDRDGLLYTSIPQNGENWTVYVDGKKADATLVGGCMVGVYLEEGQHSVVFQYQNNSFTIGLIISIVCLIAFLSLWILLYKPEFKRMKAMLQRGKYQK